MSRITQILLATASLTVILLGIAFFGMTLPDLFGLRVSEVVVADTADPTLTETLSFGSAALVGDGPTLRLPLLTTQSYAQGSFEKTSEGNIVNFAFLTPGQPARWLLPGRSALIVHAEALALSGDLIAPMMVGQDIFTTGFDAATGAASTARAPDAPHEVALMLVLAEADSNGDGRLSARDALTLALTRPDGTGRVDLAGGLTAVPQVMPSARDLAFLLQGDAGYEALRVDPVAFTVTDRQPVPLP